MNDGGTPDSLAWLMKEREAIEKRRQAAGTAREGKPIVGLALSGGGIRSASVSVGVLQALDEAGLLKEVDYLSTVSGGGYTGIGWVSRLANEGPAAGGRFPYAKDQEAFAWLRNRASYLLPPGAWEVMKVLAMIVRKLAGNSFRLLSGLLLLAACLALLDLASRVLPWGLNEPSTLALHAVVAVLGIAIATGFVTCLIDTRRFAAPADDKGMLTRVERANGKAIGKVRTATTDRAAALVLWFSLGLLVLAVQPLMLSLAPRFMASGSEAASWKWDELAGLAAGVPTILAALGLGARLRGRIAGIATTVLAAAAVAALYLLALLVAATQLMPPAGGGLATFGPAVGAGLGAVGLLLLGGAISPNATSMHGFYRHRLADAFIGNGQAPPLSALRPARTGGPFPVVNATVNGVVDGGEARRGRTTCAFTMTPFAIGNDALGYCRTEAVEEADPRFDAASAMAISAAAIGGNQASMGLGARLLRGLLNLRTARWMPNPKRLREDGATPRSAAWWARLQPKLQVTEFFGIRRIGSRTRHILVSDGGHHENLGLNALVHRGCDVIIVVDAEADPGMTFNGLAVATRLARLDAEGTLIDITPAALGHEKETGCVRAHYCQGAIVYGGELAARSADGEAKLLYIKASVSGDEALDILEYRTRNPDFPHETTADQFFSEEQFESYRCLGEHIGAKVVKTSPLRQWLEES
ncbi:patatin-like phospholipase domain-containing protein [Falsiroseomonas ponticola]|uniref:hypothetical protein n=1 Tax=Falsiroseomonas ponticola TaxID=2786951 RepID=UPI001932ED61|nr:hypothetical protein [Roseomonas ponticola]